MDRQGLSRRLRVAGLVSWACLAGLPAVAEEGATVVVLGRGDVPVPGIAVLVEGTGGWSERGRTDGAGELALGALPRDGTVRVAAWSGARQFDPRRDRPTGVPLRTARTVVRVRQVVRLTVEFVDAVTGLPVSDVPWLVMYEAGAPIPGPKLLHLGDREQRVYGIEVLTPEGRVAQGQTRVEDSDTRRLRWPDAVASAGATELRAVVALRPEASVEVRARAASGSFLRPEAVEWSWPGASLWTAAIVEPGSGGTGARLRGIPWYPAARLEVRGRGSDADGEALEGATSVRLGDDPATKRMAVLSMGPAAEEEGLGGESLIGIGGGRHRTEGGGTLALRLLRHDGAPLAGGYVRVASRRSDGDLPLVLTWVNLDEEGRAELDALAADAYSIATLSAGVLPTSGTVRVDLGQRTEVELREPAGASLDVSVVDSSARPLPFAEIRLDRPWLDEGDGTQRVDSLAGRDGRRSFRRVAAGKGKVEARWGARTGSAEVTTTDGGNVAVRLILSEPPSSR